MRSRVEQIARLFAAIESFDVRAALVGGLAVSVRARERFTRDVDVAVAVDSDDEAGQLAFAMQGEGYRLTQVLEHRASGRLATLRFVTPGQSSDEPDIDVLCASSGIEAETVEAATYVELVEKLAVPVARTAHLLAMKVLSASERRPQDVWDIQALLNAAQRADLDAALYLVDLIQERGFGRDDNDNVRVDLRDELLAFQARFAPHLDPGR